MRVIGVACHVIFVVRSNKQRALFLPIGLDDDHITIKKKYLSLFCVIIISLSFSMMMNKVKLK